MESGKDYKDTLNLPVTKFPMRANLAKREPGFLEFWHSQDIYHKALHAHEHSPERFQLHDGPPYANGDIHIGTAFNKILKDFIIKEKTMTGRYTPYVPGWDTHGLPIELRSLRDAKLSKLGTGVDPVELRKKCKATALHYLDVQREEFKRLGVLGEWEHPYMTLDPKYEHRELHAFADMVQKGLIYRGLKPVYWCTDCQTALAAGEIEYWDEESPSVYVAYPLPGAAEKFPQLAGRDVYIVIWTTTPWTLPSSAAVAVHPRYDYTFYESNGKVYVFAAALKDAVSAATGMQFTELFTVKGADLEKMKPLHPFYEHELLVVLADYVELETGTGCVHTSPGHGVEDYETGVRYGLKVYSSVDHAGRFEQEMPIVGGMTLTDGGNKAIELIKEKGRLLGLGKIDHSYPHCWRCKKPVIFRATDQWFINVKEFRDDALRIIDEGVKWIPDWGRDRIYNMVSSRSDWCISRQRVWGIPVPAIHCKDCGHFTLTPDRIRMFAEKVKDAEDGTSIWWSESLSELFGDLAKCDHCGSHNVEKDSNILDVWFDSGVSHMSVLNERFGLTWPCDMYLEGSDQHRGWFQSSLLTATAIKGEAPYKQVLTHGFTLDGEGRKMSKSLGNTIAPKEVCDEFGADILRLWVASTDYRNDVRISKPILKTLSETYRRIRNTARFLLGNLHDFNPKADAVAYDSLLSMDKWILDRLHRIIARAYDAFEEYEFHVPVSLIHSFCVNELSAFYLDISKDRLYVEGADSLTRRSAQTAMWEILSCMTRMLAPLLSFTAEEIWQEMREIDSSLPESVFLADFPKQDTTKLNDELAALWEEAEAFKGAVSRMLETMRADKTIGTSLEAQVQAKKSEGLAKVAAAFTCDELADIAIVSRFEWVDELTLPRVVKDEATGFELAGGVAEGEKCPRCWKYHEHTNAHGLCKRCAGVMNED